MYDKGIILEIKDKYCLAMTEQGAVIRIHKKQGMRVGDRIYILPEDLCREEKPSGAVPFPIARVGRSFIKAAVCAAAAFLLVFASMFTGQGEAYAMVSAVGTGDVELELDKEYRIIRVKVYGASREKEEQLSGLVGKTLEEAQPLLRGMAGPEGVVVGYALKKRGGSSAEAEFARRLELVFSGETAVYLKGNADDVKRAEAKTVSLGFYMAQKAAENGNRESVNILEYHQKVQEKKDQYDGPDRGDADDAGGKADGPGGDDGQDGDDRDSGEEQDDSRDDGEEQDDDRDDGEKDDGCDDNDKDGDGDGGHKSKPAQSRPAQKPEDSQPESAAETEEDQKKESGAGNSDVQDHSGSSGSHGEDDKDSNKKDSDDGDSQNSDDDNDNDSGDSDEDD